MSPHSSKYSFSAVFSGVERGWLSGAEYNDVILKGWSYLSSTVEADGTISGIIGGTGIKNSEEDYVPDSTEYRKAGPGVGGVLRAVAAMEQFNRSRK